MKDNKTKTFTIIAGINGVGKSSFSGARELENCIDVDKIAFERGISNFEAGKIALKMVTDFLDKGLSFAQETTLSGNNVFHTATKAKVLGYKVRLFYIGLDTVEESIIRIDNRVRRGGHHIKTHDVLRRYEKRFVVLKKLLPICDEAVFLDNSNGFMIASENNEWFRKGDFQHRTVIRPE